MSFTESQARGSLYTKPEEYCTCDRCGCVVPTANTTTWPGPEGVQHLCVNKERCERLRKQLDDERRRR